MTTCPFCGRDPFHYVDIGVGLEAAAVVCCDLGDLYFRGARDPIDHEVVIDPETFRGLGNKLAAQHERLSAIADLPDECVNSLTHKTQVDDSGELVGVSHQAVDEIYAALQKARGS